MTYENVAFRMCEPIEKQLRKRPDYRQLVDLSLGSAACARGQLSGARALTKDGLRGDIKTVIAATNAYKRVTSYALVPMHKIRTVNEFNKRTFT